MTLQERIKPYIEKHRLKMKLVGVQYEYVSATEDKLLVEYTAQKRVDFRLLLKDLHREFGCRIEMRQINIREHERRLKAGIACGRTICLQPFCQENWPACYYDRTNDDGQQNDDGKRDGKEDLKDWSPPTPDYPELQGNALWPID